MQGREELSNMPRHEINLKLLVAKGDLIDALGSLGVRTGDDEAPYWSDREKWLRENEDLVVEYARLLEMSKS